MLSAGDLGRRKAAASVLPLSSAGYDPKRHPKAVTGGGSTGCVLAVFFITVFVVWATRGSSNTAATVATVAPAVAPTPAAVQPETVLASQPEAAAPSLIQQQATTETIAAAAAAAASDATKDRPTDSNSNQAAAAAAEAGVGVQDAAAAEAALNAAAAAAVNSDVSNAAGWSKRDGIRRMKAKARAEAAAAAAAAEQAEKDKSALKRPVIVPSEELTLREQILKNAAVDGAAPRPPPPSPPPPLQRQKAFTSLPDAAKGAAEDDEVDAVDFMPPLIKTPRATTMDAAPITKDKAGEPVEMAALEDYSQRKPTLQRKPAVQGDTAAKEAAARLAREAALAHEERALRGGGGGGKQAPSASAEPALQQRMSDSKPASAAAPAAESAGEEISPEYNDEQGGDAPLFEDEALPEEYNEGIEEDDSDALTAEADLDAALAQERESARDAVAAAKRAIKQGKQALKGVASKQQPKGGGKSQRRRKGSKQSKGSKGRGKARSANRASKRTRRKKNTQLHRPGSNLPRSNYATTKRQELLARARAEVDEEAQHEL